MKRTLKTVLAMCIAMTLAVSLTACVTNNPPSGAKYASFMSIDINPSIELTFDENGKVASVRAKNDDAAILLTDVDLTGMTAEQATAQITQLAEKMGYLNADNTGVKILAAADSAEAEAELLRRAAEGAEKGSKLCKVTNASSLLEREVKKLQETAPSLYANLTPAKLRLIKAVMQFDKTMTVELGSTLSVKQLGNMLQSQHERMKEYISDGLEDKYEQLEGTLSAEIQAKINALYGEEYALLAQSAADIERLADRLEEQLENLPLSQEDLLAITDLLSLENTDALKDSSGNVTAESVENYLDCMDDTSDDDALEELLDQAEDILEKYDGDEQQLTDEMLAEIAAIVKEDVQITDLDALEEYAKQLEEAAEELQKSIELTAEQKTQLKQFETQLDNIEDEIEKQLKDEIKAVKEDFRKLKQQKLEIELP